MGLSASQARLLSLTGRMHDIEYKAQKLEAQKLQMANESAHVYQEYENALNLTKVQLKQIGSDGSAQYIDATYQNIVDNNYFIEFQDGRLWGKNGLVDVGKITILQSDLDTYNATKDRNFFIAVQNHRVGMNGYNAADGVYEIYTEAHLQNINTNSSAKYRLMSDIAVSSSFNQLSLNGGTFDGNGYTVSGLNKALFSTIKGGTVNNLLVSGNSSSRGLLADNVSNNAVISNVTARGTINNSTGSQIGGLIGTINDSTLDHCSASVDINGRIYIGGLVGHAANSTIENCSVSSATINGQNVVGGFIGSVSNCNIENSKSNTNITLRDNDTFNSTNYTHVAGFIGDLGGGSTVSYCSASGTVTNNNQNACGGVAGFVGQTSSDTFTTITHCDSNVNVINNIALPVGGLYHNYIAGFVGDLNKGTTNISYCNSTGSVTDTTGSSQNYIGDFASTKITTVVNNVNIDNCYAANSTGNFTDTSVNNIDNISNIQTTPVNNTIDVESPQIGHTTTLPDPGNYGEMYDKIAANMYVVGDPAEDPTNGYKNDVSWFVNMVNEGMIYLYKQDDDEKYYQVNIATDTGLQEVSDELLLKKAEAKYEADMRKINSKDKKFDTDLAALEAERNAIKTEMDTLKSVAKDNVDRTYKLFS